MLALAHAGAAGSPAAGGLNCPPFPYLHFSLLLHLTFARYLVVTVQIVAQTFCESASQIRSHPSGQVVGSVGAVHRDPIFSIGL